MKTNIELGKEADLLTWGFVSNEFEVVPDIEAVERFAALVRADERKAIYDQWHSCVMSDLENGVKWLNEKAAAEWHKNYPAQSNLFPAWIETRGNT